MKKILIAVAASLLLAAPMASCATLTGPGGVLGQTLADDKALYAAEAAYFGAATAAEQAVDAGLLRGERAAQVAAYDRTAVAALHAARAAHRAGNTAAATLAAGQALAAVADIQRLLKPQPG